VSTSPVISALKTDTPWCENKRCSESNPWPMGAKAIVLLTTPHHSALSKHCGAIKNWMEAVCETSGWHQRALSPWIGGWMDGWMDGCCIMRLAISAVTYDVFFKRLVLCAGSPNYNHWQSKLYERQAFLSYFLLYVSKQRIVRAICNMNAIHRDCGCVLPEAIILM